MPDQSIKIGVFARIWAQPVRNTSEQVVCPNGHEYKHHYKGREDWPPFCSECGKRYSLIKAVPTTRPAEFRDLDLYVEIDGPIGYARFQEVQYLNRQADDPIIVVSNSSNDGTQIAINDSFSYLADVATTLPSGAREACIEAFKSLYLAELEAVGRVEIDFGVLRWHWY